MQTNLNPTFECNLIVQSSLLANELSSKGFENTNINELSRRL